MSAVLESAAPASGEDLRAAVAERLRKLARQPQTRPLSFAQRRLWFVQQIEPNSTVYNMQRVARFAGELDIGALREALNAIAARHETLRTRFTAEEGEPVQVIEAEVRLELPIEDLTSLPATERHLAIKQSIEAAMNRPFNLSLDRLVRVSLMRLGPAEHVLIVNMHHIVSDEWSFQVFFRELAEFYSSLIKGDSIRLPDLPIQYSDYAMWQRERLTGEVFESQLGFWKAHLSGNPPGVELPTDRPRRANPMPPGAAQWRGVSRELAQQLRRLASRQGTTLFTVLLAAFKTLLYRYTHQPDIIVGSPVAGRNRVETEDLIGFFVNTLPLRSRVAGEMSFLELLSQVREIAMGAFSHQDLPFEKLVEALQPDRSVHATPFVNVMFYVLHEQSEASEWPGLNLELLDTGVGPAKFDLTLSVNEKEAGLVASALYNRELFDPETIERLLGHYVRLLEEIVAQPSRRLFELPLMGEAERQQLLVDWNDTRTEFPRSACVHELFEEQARSTPETMALEFGSSHLSYGALNKRANQVAHHLLKIGVKPGMPIAICAERSLEMIVGLLAILKAGAAYAPLDPILPKQRISELLEDLKPPVVLVSHKRLLEFLPKSPPLSRICLDRDWKAIRRQPTNDPHVQPGADGLAYISFTSGSTGRPKGVCVRHRGIVRLVKNTNYLDFAPTDIFFQLAPIAFDASTFEIWGALLNGARLAVFPPHLPTLSELAEAIQRHGVTTAWFTSGLFNQIVDEKPECLKGLRQVITGGDVLSPPHVEKALRFISSGVLLNGYGPTENTTFTTCYRIPASFAASGSVPIGRPISNTTCYVLDEHLQLVPLGVPGELCTGGDGLAAGYLNATELTEEKFIANPFRPGKRLYRTGDLVRFLADGNIQFLGRMTDQVKVRGFRVEPSEIESVLLEHAAVEQCTVIARPDASGTKQLVAYFVPGDETAPSAQVLQTFLRERLPEYMVPAFTVPLRELPLSANGKVDRTALAARDIQARITTETAGPRNDTERRLQELWEEVLDVRPIGIHDKFFALGGHSLLAVRLLALVEKRFGTKLKISVLFQNPTIAELAVVLCSNRQPGTGSSIVAIQPDGFRPPLWLVHGAGGGMFWGYNNLARHLGPEQPVFAFKSRGLDGQEEFDNVPALADAYLADLRDFQPRGPYCLGGYCFGGIVAYEMARRLRDAGEDIPFLGLINSTAPNSSYSRFRWTPISALKFVKNVFLRSFYTWRAHPEKVPGFLWWKARSLAKRFGGMAPVVHTAPSCESLSPEDWIDLSQYSEAERRVWQKHLQALRQYQPQPYAGQVTLFRSPVHLLRCSFDSRYGWEDLALGGVNQRVIPGAHETIMEEPGVKVLACAMKDCLSHRLPTKV